MIGDKMDENKHAVSLTICSSFFDRAALIMVYRARRSCILQRNRTGHALVTEEQDMRAVARMISHSTRSIVLLEQRQ